MKTWMTGLVLALGLTGAAVAGPFDDLSEQDRAALHEEFRAYLLENPEILREAMIELDRRDRAAQASRDSELIREHRDELVADGYSNVLGNPEGDITIVEFLDYQCGYCKRAHPEIKALLESDPDIRLIQKEYPVLGPASQMAARAASAVLIAQGPEVYNRFTDALMLHDGPLNEQVLLALAEESGVDIDRMLDLGNGDEVGAQLSRNLQLGRDMEISGTPTFVIGDQMLRGYAPASTFRSLIEAQRSEM
jgi:protein-disulfide isomerase